MDIISSEQNPWIKKLRALKKRKHRHENQQFVVEGIRFCAEAILHNADLEAIFISEEIINQCNIRELLKNYRGKIFVVEKNLLEKSLSTVTPQGIAGIVKMPVWDLAQVFDRGTTFLILDGVQDPGNLGTIIRTSLAAGVHGIFCLKGTVDIYNDKTLRSTMGAIFKLPVFYVEDKDLLLTKLKEQDIKLVLTDINASTFHFQIKYPPKVAIVLGSEALGIQQFETGDYAVKIPLEPNSESLNVAVAGAIIIYEVIRQRIEQKML
ncbi:MAG: TrmH family RNA methyltransferase [Peptococcales bacterium]